jgi:hypothetical protein
LIWISTDVLQEIRRDVMLKNAEARVKTFAKVAEWTALPDSLAGRN